MLKNTFRGGTVLLLTSSLFLFGCNTGSRSTKASTTAPTTSSTTGGTTSSAPVNTATPALDLASVPSQAPNPSAKIGTDSVALVVNLASTGTAPLDISDLTISSSGTVDESTDIGELKLYGDDNKNGVLDQGEPMLTTVAAPAFTVDDGSVTITLPAPITLTAGADVQFLVAVDTSSATTALAVAKIGKTVELSVANATDLSVTYGGQPVTPGGNFPITGGATTLFMHDHLLISEIVPKPATGEYIEIFNPTADTIDLVNYYLTEQSDSATTNPRHHYNLPTGANFSTTSSFDFLVRFPPGAQITPGQTITFAVDGADFQLAYGAAADYCGRNPVGGAVQCLTHNGTAWVAVPLGTIAEISPSAEPIVLFTWDGTSDLIQDVDYLYYGTPSSFNFQFDKTGISIDGPDADTTPSTFLPETPTGQQAVATLGNAPNNAIQRIDFTEGVEDQTNGNGLTGNDESSEDFGNTFANGTPTPGQP